VRHFNNNNSNNNNSNSNNNLNNNNSNNNNSNNNNILNLLVMLGDDVLAAIRLMLLSHRIRRRWETSTPLLGLGIGIQAENQAVRQFIYSCVMRVGIRCQCQVLFTLYSFPPACVASRPGATP
jgi:hypothetical protein